MYIRKLVSFSRIILHSHNSRIAWRESWPIFRNDKRLVSLSIETKLERRALQPSISNATLAKRRFLEFTNRANRPLFSNDRCFSPPIIFFNRRVDPCHFQRNTRDLRLCFFSFFFTRFEKSRTIDPCASIIPRRAFNRGVQFALRPAHFLPLGENGRRSFPTINNPCLGDESYFSPAFRIS